MRGIKLIFHHSEGTSGTPKTLLVWLTAELVSKRPWSISPIAPPIFSKHRVSCWILLEKACSRNGTNPVNIPFGLMPWYLRWLNTFNWFQNSRYNSFQASISNILGWLIRAGRMFTYVPPTIVNWTKALFDKHTCSLLWFFRVDWTSWCFHKLSSGLVPVFPIGEASIFLGII